MATLGSGSGNVIQANVNTAGFIPEVWSDEIIAAYKKNLVAANLIKKMNMKGKKGDVVHFPAPEGLPRTHSRQRDVHPRGGGRGLCGALRA